MIDLSPEPLNSKQLEYVDYIGKISIELARMAKNADVLMLAYLLDMVAQEAIGLQEASRLIAQPDKIDGRAPRHYGSDA